LRTTTTTTTTEITKAKTITSATSARSTAANQEMKTAMTITLARLTIGNEVDDDDDGK